MESFRSDLASPAPSGKSVLRRKTFKKGADQPADKSPERQQERGPSDPRKPKLFCDTSKSPSWNNALHPQTATATAKGHKKNLIGASPTPFRGHIESDSVSEEDSSAELSRSADSDQITPIKYLDVKTSSPRKKLKVASPSRASRTARTVLKVDKCTQSEHELFLAYVLDFLRALEAAIEKTEVHDVEPQLPHKKLDHFNTSVQSTPMMALEASSRSKLLELRQILMRIRSIRNSSGDLFFVSIARTFFAKSQAQVNFSQVYHNESFLKREPVVMRV